MLSQRYGFDCFMNVPEAPAPPWRAGNAVLAYAVLPAHVLVPALCFRLHSEKDCRPLLEDKASPKALVVVLLWTIAQAPCRQKRLPLALTRRALEVRALIFFYLTRMKKIPRHAGAAYASKDDGSGQEPEFECQKTVAACGLRGPPPKASAPSVAADGGLAASKRCVLPIKCMMRSRGPHLRPKSFRSAGSFRWRAFL